jgi:hypothetical protein
MVISLLLDRNRPWLEIVASPAGIAAYGILSFGLLRYFYESVRYQYFLYPLFLTVMATASARLLGKTRGACVFLVLFALCGDFSPGHIARVGGDEIGFRMGRFRDRREIWYPRSDYRSAAAALAQFARRATPVVIGTCEPVAYYFKGDFVRYLDRSEFPFWEQSRDKGARELWTQRPLLSTAEELRRWSAGYREILLVRRLPGDANELDPQRVWPERLIAVTEEFRSMDGGVDIVRVALSLQSSERGASKR